MTDIGRRRTVNTAVSALYTAAAGSVLLLPYASFNPELGSVALAWTAALAFWIGILGAGVLILLLAARLRRQRRLPKGRPGVFRFFSNPAAGVNDLALLVSAVLLLFCVVGILPADGAFAYWNLAAVLFTLCMHGYLNGRVFRALRGDPGKQEVRK